MTLPQSGEEETTLQKLGHKGTICHAANVDGSDPRHIGPRFRIQCVELGIKERPGC